MAYLFFLSEILSPGNLCFSYHCLSHRKLNLLNPVCPVYELFIYEQLINKTVKILSKVILFLHNLFNNLPL